MSGKIREKSGNFEVDDKRQPSFGFSSPEHEVLMVSYCDQSLSVVRHSSSTICFKS